MKHNSTVTSRNTKRLRIRFIVDEKAYETSCNIDFGSFRSGDVIDITELQSDIRKGVQSGGKEKRIITL